MSVNENPPKDVASTKKLLATLPVLNAISSGTTTVKTLAVLLHRHRSRINRILNRCEKKGLIKKIGKYAGVFELTEEGKKFLEKTNSATASEQYPHNKHNTVIQNSFLQVQSFDTGSGLFRGHRIEVKYPILRDNSAGKIDWDTINYRFRNSKLYHKKIDFPFAVGVKKADNSVSLTLEPFEREREFFDSEVFQYALRAQQLAHWFLKRRGLLFDVLNGKAVKTEIAEQQPEFDSVMEKKNTEKLFTGRKAVTVFDTDMEEWIKLDASKKILEFETNSLSMMDKLRLMPEFVWQSRNSLKVLGNSYQVFIDSLKLYNENALKAAELNREFGINYKSHRRVLDKIETAVGELTKAVEKRRKKKKSLKKEGVGAERPFRGIS